MHCKDNISELHIFEDKSLDFCAIISLKKYGRGPALGGCRMLSYSSVDAAIAEANRLAHAMSYKAALSQLPHDGGKAIIMRSTQSVDHTAVLKRFAECVHSLNGNYITTLDSGTSQSDMSIIKKYTPYVAGYLEEDHSDNNPSVSTAFGIFEGIQAAVKLIYGHDQLTGLRVAIQGVGHVGYYLAKYLYQAGAELIVCDINPVKAKRCAKEFNATIIKEPSAIYAVPCDIFSPCALGQIINLLTLPQFKTKMIAGAANDQLSSPTMAKELAQRDIFYVPDYLINAGGLIHLSLERQHNKQIITEHVARIAERIVSLALTAKQQGKSLFEVTEGMAEECLK